MPIRPDLRHHYGPQWLKEVRPSILARAKYRCEQCGKPNRQIVDTVTTGDSMFWRVAPDFATWDPYELRRRRLVRGFWVDHFGHTFRDLQIPPGARVRSVRVVLTIAHLDHDPTNNDDKNLKALCQWCHLHHDVLHHAQTRAERKDAARPLLAACSVVTDRENESASRGGTAAPRPAEPSRSERP